MIRSLALVSSVASVLVSFWLLSVITVVLPRVDPDRVPFWSVVMVGFFGFGALGWYVVQHERAPALVRHLLLGASVAAVALGLTAVVHHQIQAQRTGHFEGYIVLMGATLAGQGAFLTAYLARRRARPPASTI
jgi:hypothetical protein